MFNREPRCPSYRQHPNHNISVSMRLQLHADMQNKLRSPKSVPYTRWSRSPAVAERLCSVLWDQVTDGHTEIRGG